MLRVCDILIYEEPSVKAFRNDETVETLGFFARAWSHARFCRRVGAVVDSTHK